MAMTLHVQVPEGVSASTLAQEVQKRLDAIGEIDEVVAHPESPRIAAEIIAGIAITVSIIKGSGEIADALHTAIPKMKAVLQDLGLTEAQVEVAGKEVPMDKLSHSDIQRLSP